MKPTALPYLSHDGGHTTTSVSVVKHRSDYYLPHFAVALNDGKVRYSTSSLTIDTTLTYAQHGGLDVDLVNKSVSDWYGVYLVPKTGDDDQLDAIATFNSVSTGPNNEPVHRYVGSFYIGSAGYIYAFTQSGRMFLLHRITTWPKIADTTSGNVNTWNNVNLGATNLLPTGVADTILAKALIAFTCNSTGYMGLYVQSPSTLSESSPSSNGTGVAMIEARASIATNEMSAFREIPMESDVVQWYAYIENGTTKTNNRTAIAIVGWRDKYLQH